MVLAQPVTLERLILTAGLLATEKNGSKRWYQVTSSNPTDELIPGLVGVIWDERKLKCVAPGLIPSRYPDLRTAERYVRAILSCFELVAHVAGAEIDPGRDHAPAFNELRGKMQEQGYVDLLKATPEFVSHWGLELFDLPYSELVKQVSKYVS